jgi:hypothetical protein
MVFYIQDFCFSGLDLALNVLKIKPLLWSWFCARLQVKMPTALDSIKEANAKPRKSFLEY